MNWKNLEKLKIQSRNYSNGRRKVINECKIIRGFQKNYLFIRVFGKFIILKFPSSFEVELSLTSYAVICQQIFCSFLDNRVVFLEQKKSLNNLSKRLMIKKRLNLEM